MNDYARATGGSVRTDQPVLDNKDTLPPLTDAQQARADAARDFVREHMPELRSLIRELVAIGYMAGWRDVQNCRLLSEKVSP